MERLLHYQVEAYEDIFEVWLEEVVDSVPGAESYASIPDMHVDQGHAKVALSAQHIVSRGLP